MKNYNHEKINELIQPLMDMMREEFPNGFKLIIGGNFAEIEYQHTEMMFEHKDVRKEIREFGESFLKDLINDTDKTEKHSIKENTEKAE